MTGPLEVLAVAFVAQLAVLPGEKVQFVIAGLATRYDPRVVVASAGTAFAGWTALEILFGAALQSALPPVVLDAIAAGLFLLFAVLLVRSAPPRHREVAEADGGEPRDAAPQVPVLGRDLTGSLDGFVPIFAVMAAGEFGDKTQLVTIGLAMQYGAHPAIWAGEMLAIVPVSLANAYLFHHFVGRVDVRTAHLAGAALFCFFGLDAVSAILLGVSPWEVAVGAAADALLAVG